ncbi:MAG: hypothetical protein KDN19_00640 [Verrucomicrobiae bacterium]|nr:hypothetical protein [Verrucomicrobiae bacterium]
MPTDDSNLPSDPAPATEVRGRWLPFLLFAVALGFVISVLFISLRPRVPTADPKPALSAAPALPSPKSDSTDAGTPALSRRVRGTVRVAGNEAAVVALPGQTPGTNLLISVTPFPMPDGTVQMSIREAQLSESAIDLADGGELFPDSFEPDRVNAIPIPRVESFREVTEWLTTTTWISYPTMVARDGESAHFVSKISKPGAPEDDWLGKSYEIRTKSLTDGGFQIDVDLDLRELK